MTRISAKTVSNFINPNQRYPMGCLRAQRLGCDLILSTQNPKAIAAKEFAAKAGLNQKIGNFFHKMLENFIEYVETIGKKYKMK